jgi:hypothetical protein
MKQLSDVEWEFKQATSLNQTPIDGLSVTYKYIDGGLR